VGKVGQEVDVDVPPVGPVDVPPVGPVDIQLVGPVVGPVRVVPVVLGPVAVDGAEVLLVVEVEPWLAGASTTADRADRAAVERVMRASRAGRTRWESDIVVLSHRAGADPRSAMIRRVIAAA
jgi:hypothetical protein